QGLPFDNGEFEIIEEPINTPWPNNDPLHFSADRIQWSGEFLGSREQGVGSREENLNVLHAY
ncbi:MAG: hypothetical protein F6K65_36405, partial [Moorea sp. SIO3C2]|nr:hypothetical protein [Moorena sp. SIO3C2]